MKTNFKWDVAAIGEIICDFTCGENDDSFVFNAGGAPCNALCMGARLGLKTAVISAVGNDVIGVRLKEKISCYGVDTSAVELLNTAATPLSFVHTGENGERTFSFFKNKSADEFIGENGLPKEILKQCRIFHTGTFLLASAVSARSVIKAVDTAKNSGAVISVDVNLRPAIWKNRAKMLQAADKLCKKADIVKLSLEEARLITKKENAPGAAGEFLKRYPETGLLLITCGENGSYAFYRGKASYMPAFKVNSVDTTGAGDAFTGACLSFICGCKSREEFEAGLSEMLKKANAAAALTCTRAGAMPAMPDEKEIRDFVMGV